MPIFSPHFMEIRHEESKDFQKNPYFQSCIQGGHHLLNLVYRISVFATRDLQKCTTLYTRLLCIQGLAMGCLQDFIPHRSRSRAIIPHSSPQIARKFGVMKKGHKGKRRHPAFRCAQIGLSLGIAEALAGTVVSRCSTVPVHPLARAPYRPGLDSRWGSIPPGSAPASLRSLWCPAAASGRCVTAEFRWGLISCLTPSATPPCSRLVAESADLPAGAGMWPSLVIADVTRLCFQR